MKKVNEKEAKQQNEPISITKVLRENHTWLLTVLTLLGIFLSGAFKLIDFVKNQFYFLHFGLNPELYQYNGNGILYEAVYSVLLMISLYIAAISIYEIITRIKNGQSCLSYLYVYLCSNLLVTLGITSTTSIANLFISFILSMIAELVVLFILKKMQKKMNSELAEEDGNSYSTKELVQEFIFVCFGVFASIIVTFSISQLGMLFFQTDYRTIENNRVIIYTTENYYLTLDCEVSGDSLIIYKGTETKINTDNVHSYLKRYKKIIIK